jgi:hypothetical protein
LRKVFLMYECLVCHGLRSTVLGDVCESCRPHYNAWYAKLASACKRAARREAYDARVEDDIRKARAAEACRKLGIEFPEDAL